MKLILVAMVALALGACGGNDPIDLLKATQSPTAQMVAGVPILGKACPSLAGNAQRYQVGLATEGAASMDAQREFGASRTVRYALTIAQPEPGKAYDVGDRCDYEVSVAPPGGMVTGKAACIRLCNSGAHAETGYYVRKL